MTVTVRFYPSAHGARQEFTTNPNNLLNQEDGTCAYVNMLAGATKYHDATTFKDSAGVSIADKIPAGSTLVKAYVGINANWQQNNVNLVVSAQIRKKLDVNTYSADQAGQGLSCPAAGTVNEQRINQFGLIFTMEDYRTENFDFWFKAVNGSAGLARPYVDAGWVKIEYTPPAVPSAGMMDGFVCISMLKRLPRLLPSFSAKNVLDGWKAKCKLNMRTVRKLAVRACCS